MKKIISIVLATIMVFCAMPITALAEEPTLDINEVMDAGLDYSAYDSIVAQVDALSDKEFTKESIASVKAAVADRDTLMTQDAIDNAIREIAFQIASLEKNRFTVDYIIHNSNEEEIVYSYVFSYGDVVSLNVSNGEVPYKWVMSDSESDRLINNGDEDISVVVTDDCQITAFTDIAPEVKERLIEVRFLSFSGKTINIVYTDDIYNIDMPEAPELPFYYFNEWIQLNDTTYQASYLSENVCDGVHHRYMAVVTKAGCEQYGYALFQCACGEAFRTEYTAPIGHKYVEGEKYCANGCGTYMSSYFDNEYEDSDEPTDPVTPTEPSQPEESNEDYGFDKSGYNYIVVAP